MRTPTESRVEILTVIPSLAQAFTTVVTSFVSDIILPPLSVILPLNANLDFKFAVLQAGDNYKKWGGYNTIEQAQDDGAVIMACKYSTLPSPLPFLPLRRPVTGQHHISTDGMHGSKDGVFLNKTINFIGLGMALYGLASLYEYCASRYGGDPIIKHTEKCRYCKKRVNVKVCLLYFLSLGGYGSSYEMT